jgi:hypothetical protein
LATRREFGVLGVPLWAGTSSNVVFGKRLKYSRVLNWLDPVTHRALKLISYSRPSTIAWPLAKVVSAWL